MIIYGIKTCDTCRKAAKALGDQGHRPTFVDVRAEPLGTAKLEHFLTVLGEALINRRSTTWRAMSDADRAGDALALLQAHPTLMKRPVIDADGTLYLGWGKDVQSALIK